MNVLDLCDGCHSVIAYFSGLVLNAHYLLAAYPQFLQNTHDIPIKSGGLRFPQL
jgi:hypothetical protein